jgi:hypothetical protein
VSKELLDAHLKAHHFQCKKCEFWMMNQLQSYDHTCVPKSQPLLEIESVQMTDDEKTDIDIDTEKEEKEKETARSKRKERIATKRKVLEHLNFRWQKCEAHKQLPCSRDELKNCDRCRLLRFTIQNKK